MTISKTFFRSAVGALFLLLIVNPVVAAATPKLRVGFINGLSGPWAPYGVAYRQGIEIAHVEDRVEFLYEDDQFDPAKTVTAFNKLTSDNSVDAVLIGDDQTGQAIAPLAKRKGVALLVWAGVSDTYKSNPYVFRLWDSVDSEIGPLGELVQQRGFKAVQIYVSIHPYASRWGQSSCQSLGKSCVGVEEFLTDPPDLRVQILKGKKAGVNAFMLCLNPGLNGLFARQMRELHVQVPLVGCNFFENSIDLEAAGSALDGSDFVAPQVSPEFRDKYLQASGGTSQLISAAVHHDAALLLARLANIAGIRRDNIVGEIMRMKPFEGALGAFTPVNQDGDRHMKLQMRRYHIDNRLIVPQ